MIVSKSCEVDNKINNVICYMEYLNYIMLREFNQHYLNASTSVVSCKSYVGVPLLNYNSRCLMHVQICMYHADEMYDCIIYA